MKDEILQTALKQFLKYGIRQISIQKLVEPLGISTKTVYKYFKNKEELLEESLHLYYNQQYQMLEDLVPGQNAASIFIDIWYSAIEVEYKVNKAFFYDLHYYYPELGRKTEAATSKKFSELFIRVIQNGIEDGMFRDVIIPEVVLEGMFVLHTAIVREERFKRFRLSPSVILSNTIASYIRGFCTEKGIQELDERIQMLSTVKGVKALRERIPHYQS